MLYVLRLSTGDCILVEAPDQSIARDSALAYRLEEGESVVSIRPLPRFAARFSPNDSASLDVNSWDDATLDDILAHEYPLLNEAFRQANSAPLMKAASVNRDASTSSKTRTKIIWRSSARDCGWNCKNSVQSTQRNRKRAHNAFKCRGGRIRPPQVAKR